MTEQLAEAHSRIDTTDELVRRVDSELSARERRERRERKRAEAGLATRLRWSIFGMDLSEVDELTDVLADATGTTPEEIERGAEDVDMELVDIEAVPERQPITWGSEQ